MVIFFFIFLHSCTSQSKERVLNSIDLEKKYWYAGFDNQLEEEDLAWSPKLYYLSFLDNLRVHGGYTTTYENNNRNYLKDKLDKVNSIFSHLEELLLVLFPSKDGSLSVRSGSVSNINLWVLFSMNSSEKNNNPLQIENKLILTFILNNIYQLIKLAEEILLDNDSLDNLKKTSAQETVLQKKEKFEKNKKILQSELNEKLKTNSTFSSRNILKMKNGILSPVFKLLTEIIHLDPIEELSKYKQLLEEKELIKHAFMKWALMHIGIDKQEIKKFIASLVFFKPKGEVIISEIEKIFIKKKISFNDLSSIYSFDMTLFGFGYAHVFNNDMQGETTFSDCVETALRHFFNYVFWKNDKFNIQGSLNEKLKTYYSGLTYKRALQASIVERSAWNKIVSNIPGAKYKIDNKNELKSSVSNFIYVVQYLLSSDSFSSDYKDLQKEDVVKELKNINKKLNALTKKNIKLKMTEHSLEEAKINVDDFLKISILDKTAQTSIIKKLSPPTEKFTGKVDSLHVLEYAFLSNYYIFNKKKSNIYSFFSSIVNEEENIHDFFLKCERLKESDLKKYSKYIGNVLYFLGRNNYSLEVFISNSFFLKIFNILKNNINNQFLKNFSRGITHVNVNKYNISAHREFLKDNLLTILQNNKEELLTIDLDLEDIFNGFPENILEYVLQCKNLEKLKLKNIKAKGNIPLELSELVNLKELDLSNNEFTGNIPTEIWSLKNLKDLNLSKNNLTGEIPKESYAFLYLNLSYNQLEGKIPFQLEKFKINPQIDIKKKEYVLSVENELNK